MCCTVSHRTQAEQTREINARTVQQLIANAITTPPPTPIPELGKKNMFSASTCKQKAE